MNPCCFIFDPRGSGVAKWGGVSMQTILNLTKHKPEAKWVVFYSFAAGPKDGLYYDAQDIEQMNHARPRGE